MNIALNLVASSCVYSSLELQAAKTAMKPN